MIRIAIAGAGKAGSSLLDIFSKSKEIDLVGIVDINSEAPGLKTAKGKGIYTAHNLMALRDRAPQVIINATGDNDLAEFVSSHFSFPVEVMGGDAAYVLWEVVNENVKSQTELYELNESLEEKVKSRTKELELSNMELSKTSTMKSRFIANASHELRTPLNSIIGFSEILKNKMFGSLNEKQELYANNIYTSGKHLLHLVNSILDLARIESGKTEVICEKFDVKETVNEILDVLRSLSDTKSIRLTNNLPSDILISADKLKFKQIFYNLISNAIKFTQKNGRVGIKGELLHDNIQIPQAPNNNKFIKLTVWDSGIGIKPEDREKVFEEFQQIDESKSTKGTGLGLSLTKKLVEIHAGHIEVEESAEKGASFNVYLPLMNFESKRKRASGLIDQTTGLFNEKYYSIRLSQEVCRAKRYKVPFALVLISIDHFIHYEKLKGGYYANLVMKKTADTIKKNLRTSDVLMRCSYGSFAIILTSTSKKPAIGITQRFVSLINDYSYLEEDVQPMGKITASMGVGEYRCQSTEEMHNIVHDAVLKAMDKGGNRVECVQYN